VIRKTLPMLSLAALLLLAYAARADHHETPENAVGDLADAHLTDEERAELIGLLEDSWAEFETLVEDVPDAQWATPPAEDKWSVGEVTEHLLLAESFLRGMADAALAADPDPEWRTADAKGLAPILENVPDRTQTFQAPEPLVPTGELSRREAMDRFRAERDKTLAMVREADGPVKAHTSPNPLLETANVRQWIAFVAAHNLRHNQQIAEAKEMLGM
jgi:hypothetical protein